MNEANNRVLVQDRVDEQAGWADQPRVDRWSQQLGWFRFYFGNGHGHWTWSPQVEQIYGYRPGTATPGTALVLSHVHPDDCQRVTATLDNVRRTHQPLSSRHRIIDTRQRVHDVMVIGAPFYDKQGSPVGMRGFCLDVTPAGPGRLAEQLRVTAANGDTDDQRRRIRAATRC